MKGVVSKFRSSLVNLKRPFRVDKVVLDAIYPPVCLVCGHASESGLDCCAGCRADLPHPGGNCGRCAIALPTDRPLCGVCTRTLPPFDSAFVPYIYRQPLDRLVQAFKFRRDLAAGRLLAGLLARAAREREIALPEALVPVPLHLRRQLWRGFNQADFLARDVGRQLGIPVARLLKRRRRTAVQSDLPATKRRGNVRGAFAVGTTPVGLTHVALIDDVMTTGATVSECARVLKRAGATCVEAWAVARA